MRFLIESCSVILAITTIFAPVFTLPSPYAHEARDVDLIDSPELVVRDLEVRATSAANTEPASTAKAKSTAAASAKATNTEPASSAKAASTVAASVKATSTA